MAPSRRMVSPETEAFETIIQTYVQKITTDYQKRKSDFHMREETARKAANDEIEELQAQIENEQDEMQQLHDEEARNREERDRVLQEKQRIQREENRILLEEDRIRRDMNTRNNSLWHKREKIRDYAVKSEAAAKNLRAEYDEYRKKLKAQFALSNLDDQPSLPTKAVRIMPVFASERREDSTERGRAHSEEMETQYTTGDVRRSSRRRTSLVGDVRRQVTPEGTEQENHLLDPAASAPATVTRPHRQRTRPARFVDSGGGDTTPSNQAKSSNNSNAVGGDDAEEVDGEDEGESSFNRSPGQKRSRANSNSASRPRKKARQEKTIAFRDVFKKGEAESKYMIFSYPGDPGEWYILRCSEHDMDFNKGLKAAAIHLRTHPELEMVSLTNILALDICGVKVIGCSQDLADQNNAAYRTSLGVPESNEKTGHNGQSNNETQESQSNKKSFVGIIAPIVGQVYRAFWPGSRDWYAAVMLPFGSLNEVGIAGHINDTGLVKSIPRCYRSEGSKITGWTEGFEDGGPSVNKRKFPVLTFRDSLRVPLFEPFEIPRDYNALAWQPAKHLQHFALDDEESKKVKGYNAASQYLQRREIANNKPLGQSDSIFSPADPQRANNSIATNGGHGSGTREEASPSVTAPLGPRQNASQATRTASAVLSDNDDHKTSGVPNRDSQGNVKVTTTSQATEVHQQLGQNLNNMHRKAVQCAPTRRQATPYQSTRRAVNNSLGQFSPEASDIDIDLDLARNVEMALNNLSDDRQRRAQSPATSTALNTASHREAAVNNTTPQTVLRHTTSVSNSNAHDAQSFHASQNYSPTAYNNSLTTPTGLRQMNRSQSFFETTLASLPPGPEQSPTARGSTTEDRARTENRNDAVLTKSLPPPPFTYAPMLSGLHYMPPVQSGQSITSPRGPGSALPSEGPGLPPSHNTELAKLQPTTRNQAGQSNTFIPPRLDNANIHHGSGSNPTLSPASTSNRPYIPPLNRADTMKPQASMKNVPRQPEASTSSQLSNGRNGDLRSRPPETPASSMPGAGKDAGQASSSSRVGTAKPIGLYTATPTDISENNVIMQQLARDALTGIDSPSSTKRLAEGRGQSQDVHDARRLTMALASSQNFFR